MKAILKKSAAAEPFSFSFVDDSGKMILRSENYKAKDSATKGINSVKKNCTEDKRYIFKESSDGRFFFNVKSANGQVVATSAMFPTEADRSATIASIKMRLPTCDVEEQLGK